jgi:hypothetical protein
MRLHSKLAIFLFLLLFSNISQAYACTIFTDTQGELVLFAGNEDQNQNESYLMVDTDGPFNVVYFGTPWAGLPLIPQMGMNEQGLCYDANWIPSEELNGVDFTLYDEWPVPHLMRECSTVDEVLDMVSEYNWGASIDYQMHFADATGDAAVIHPGPDCEMTYTRKSNGDGYLVSTNFNIERLKTGSYSCERYSTAVDMLMAEHTLSVEFMASVLDATHMEGSVSTIFSGIFDPTTGTIYLYYNHRFHEPIVLDVDEVVAEGARQLPLSDIVSTGLSQTAFLELAPFILLGLVMIGLLIYHKTRR